MRVMGLDLNLLVVFRAMMDNRSVTGAARQLHITQPAVSNALQFCARGRLVYHDLPPETPGPSMVIQIEKARENDAGLRWLVDQRLHGRGSGEAGIGTGPARGA